MFNDLPQQGRAETFGGAGAQSIKGAHGTQLLIGLCCLLICVSKWMLLYCFPVARMVEHGASNAKIMGSIPRESKS